jgi:hypothetical protein
MKASKRLEDAFATIQKAMLEIFGLKAKPDGTTAPNVSVELIAEDGVSAIAAAEAMVVIDGWLYVMDSEMDKETITKTVKVPAWYVSYGWNDPGVRYYRDGSGQPPSWEVADIGTYQSLCVAISNCATRIVQRHLDGLGQQEMCEQMAKERDHDCGVGDILDQLGIP